MAFPHPEHVRPTKRCLDDLGLKPPTLDVRLDELDHPVIVDAQRMPQLLAAGSTERIASLPDRVWLKHRSGRSRAAVIHLAESDLTDILRSAKRDGHWWIGAAGNRRADSGDDFYAALLKSAEAHGSKKHPTTDHLLPQEWDEKRLIAELALAWVRTVKQMVLTVVGTSLRTGKVATATARNHEVSALVRAKDGEAYLAIIAEGVPDPKVVAIILSSVPGLMEGDWQVEPQGVAGLKPGPGQVIWSAVLPPEAQSAILDALPDEE